MDRFFSKLDLRDIKIDPFKTSFPPDAEEAPAEAEALAAAAGDPPPDPERSPAPDRGASEAAAAADESAPVIGGERRPHVPAWAEPVTNGHVGPAGGGAHWGDPSAGPVADQEASTAHRGGATVGAGSDEGGAFERSGEPAAAANGVELGSGGEGEVLKVSARSRPSAVAGAIAGVVREAGRADVQAIGAGATNQAVKAVAIARDYLRETGIEAVCLPAFIDVTIENEDRTAIRLVVEPR